MGANRTMGFGIAFDTTTLRETSIHRRPPTRPMKPASSINGIVCTIANPIICGPCVQVRTSVRKRFVPQRSRLEREAGTLQPSKVGKANFLVISQHASTFGEPIDDIARVVISRQTGRFDEGRVSRFSSQVQHCRLAAKDRCVECGMFIFGLLYIGLRVSENQDLSPPRNACA